MIRPASVADIWALRRKPRRRIFFYNDALLASSYHPYLLAQHSVLDPLGSRLDQMTLVLRDHGLRGFLQARRRSNRREVDLQFLTAYRRPLAHLSDGDMFYQLIEDLVKRSGERGIERMFAAVGPRSTDVNEVLRQLGFQPYAQQMVWMLAEPAIEAGSTIVALRSQTRRDAWALQQLYMSVTPRHVQQAELRDSDAWQLPRRPQLLQGRQQGWILGDDQSLTVYLHLLSGSLGHVLRPMVAPHLLEEAAAMVRYVLSQLHDRRPIFAVIPTYQGELGRVLADLGFVERGEQTIFAKQLALTKRQPAFLPALRRAEPGEGAMALSLPVAAEHI